MTKARRKKNDKTVLVRLPEEVKEQFMKLCDKELIDMSVKIRYLIYKELQKKENE